MEELQCKTVFTIPVFGGIPIAESVAVTWVIVIGARKKPECGKPRQETDFAGNRCQFSS